MSWMSKLYETYEAASASELPDRDMLMPVSHTIQNTHIRIVVDEKGNFKRASVLEKPQIILPATEASAGRSAGEAPHALADKIHYVAGDYPDFGGKKKAYFPGFEQQLKDWCNSKFSHPKAKAVHAYIKKGQVVKDLIKAGILHVDENNRLLQKWPHEVTEDYPLPAIFKVLPKTAGRVEQGDALVSWAVEEPGNPDSQTWNEPDLQRSWIEYDAMAPGARGLCYISGEEQTLAKSHPAKLRHSGDKAKLVSANDLSGFTFKGRFTDTKTTIAQKGSQAVGVGLEVTQKVHNALRWLVSRQGYRNGDQVYITWAVSGKKVPEPLADTIALMTAAPVFHKDSEEEKLPQLDHGKDLGQQFAIKFNNCLRGYSNYLEPNEQIVIMGLDSATPGRMGVIYYRELPASEFLDRIGQWHEQFAWPQRRTAEVSGANEKKKPTKKTIWPISTPVPRVIAETAYGDVIKSNDALKKSILERIMPCIVDGQSFPRDILLSALRRAGNRNTCEKWEWERNLGVACALFKGFYMRHPDLTKRREYKMALEEDRHTRDYLYGRLLAIAERLEEVSLNAGGEHRPTTAQRLMQRFADRPYSTWRNIELALQPYIQRLKRDRAGFLINRNKELNAVFEAFETEDFTRDTPLSGEFLLGYHCQKQFWFKQKSESEN